MLGHILALCKWAVTGAWIMVGSWNICLASFHAGNSGPDGSQPPGYLQWFRKHTSGMLLGQYDFLTFPVSWARSHVIVRDQQGAKAGDSWLFTVVLKAFQWDGIGLVYVPAKSSQLGQIPSWPGWMTPSRLFTVVEKALQWDSIGPVYVLAKSMGWHRSRAGGSCLGSVLNQLQLAGMDDTLQAIYSGSEGTPVGFYWASICSGKVHSAGPNSQLVTIIQDTYWPYARGPGQMPSLWWLIGMDAQLRPLNVTSLDDGLVFWHPLANA
ncbi:hypothetical protein BKA82DRAFT_4017658 [Pisolithus tinctorius]|nr:hypothetical protein BKA82DRAFT_4017658 [Pisolithus tinctorius]